MTRPPASVPVSSPRWKRALATLGLELGYFSGLAGLLGRKTGGLGVIIRFERVRPMVDQANRWQVQLLKETRRGNGGEKLMMPLLMTMNCVAAGLGWTG